ncbi:MAG: T9SS type A sorting domain-containing protein [Chloroflexota bacterium]
MKRLITSLYILSFFSLVFTSVSLSGQTTASREVLLTEEFNYPAGDIPPGWVNLGDQPSEWNVSNTSYCGGTAPELMMSYGFQVGLSRLVSAPIDITGHQDLKLKYRQYLINYEMDWGEIIGLDITFDGGTTWQTLWERPLGTLSIPPDFVEYYFSAPENATQVQYAFRYEGNNNAINMWLIDDVTLETVGQNDLLSSSFSGNNAPVAGSASTYTIEVLNAGSSTQSDYTVKLMKEGGIELASVAGEPIEFAQKIAYNLEWTPLASETGNTTAYGVIQFTQDEIPGNNQTRTMNVTVHPENVSYVEIGDGFTPTTNLPYNFFNFYSFTQTLYYPEEIGMNGDSIIGIRYTGQFDQYTEGVYLQIMLGETTNSNLTDTWLDPSGFKMVFEGAVNYEKGLNDIYINFDEGYKYKGQNLVIQSVKNLPMQLFLTPFICTYDSASQRSRCAEKDDAPYDPMTLPEWGYTIDVYPNITLFYATGPLKVDDIAKDINLKVYPNPATSSLHIQADSDIQSLRLLNTLGQELYHSTIEDNQHNININQYQSGIYLLQIMTTKGTTTQKVRIL